VERKGSKRLRRAVEAGELTVTRAAGFAGASREKQEELLDRAAKTANRAEREAVFAAAAKDLAAWSRGEAGEEAPEDDVRRMAQRRCLRRLASLLQEAHDPDLEYRVVVEDLGRLVGVAEAVEQVVNGEIEPGDPSRQDDEEAA
jgi:hypothetical protein